MKDNKFFSIKSKTKFLSSTGGMKKRIFEAPIRKCGVQTNKKKKTRQVTGFLFADGASGAWRGFFWKRAALQQKRRSCVEHGKILPERRAVIRLSLVSSRIRWRQSNDWGRYGEQYPRHQLHAPMRRSYYRLRGLAPTKFRILPQTLLEKDGHGVIRQTDS